jgi:hypothetical protein
VGQIKTPGILAGGNMIPVVLRISGSLFYHTLKGVAKGYYGYSLEPIHDFFPPAQIDSPDLETMSISLNYEHLRKSHAAPKKITKLSQTEYKKPITRFSDKRKAL